MTCVATDGRTMAADGMMTDHGAIIATDERKVERLIDGRICGYAGDCAGGMQIRAWVENSVGPFPKVDADTQVIVLNLNGTVDLYESGCAGRPVRVRVPMAIGSGMDGALCAMDAGASPEQAVRIVAGRIPTVGGKIQVETLSSADR